MSNASTPWSIYVLIDPHTLAVRYVGHTHQTLLERLGHHIAESGRLDRPKNLWLRQLAAGGRMPFIIEVDQEVDRAGALRLEQQWMDKFDDLLNQNAARLA